MLKWYASSHTTSAMLVANNDQSWGVEEIEGERKYTRHVFFTGPNNEVINARLVYDYRECARVETVASH